MAKCQVHIAAYSGQEPPTQKERDPLTDTLSDRTEFLFLRGRFSENQ